MIADLKPGVEVVNFFVLRKKEIKSKRESGDFYLSLELGDRSGRIFGTVWDDVQNVSSMLTSGDVVKVKAKTTDYRNRIHLQIEKVRRAEDTDNVDLKLLVPTIDKDIKKLFSELGLFIDSVKEPHLNQLLKDIFSNKEIRQRFGKAPGGKLWHHNYLGGLLEHTLSVTGIALDVAKRYPAVDLDLLTTAGLLHDLGKIKSYQYDTLIDFNDQGRLLGHIVIGSQMVTDAIRKVDDFPEELAMKLSHLILSHQGKLENASPVVPMMLEGIILYYADDLDSKANAFLRIRKKESVNKWSSYVRLLNQYFYFGSKTE